MMIAFGKKSSVLLFALLSSLGTAASSEDVSVCEAMGIIANRIMTDRQSGSTMSQMMRAINKAGDPSAQTLVKSLVIGAFEQPQMMTEENRAQMALEYQNAIELGCYKQGGN